MGGLGRSGAPVRRQDLDPAIVAVLGTEGTARPLEIASLETALAPPLGLGTGPAPPTLEEVLARTAIGPEPVTKVVIRKRFHWVPTKVPP